MNISGADELMKTLDKLPDSMQNKCLRAAMKAGAQIVANAAAANVEAIVSDKSSGVLAKSIRTYTLSKVNDSIRMGVMVKKGAVNPIKVDGHGAPVSVALYGNVLEYGKLNQPPQSWMRKAARENVPKVLATVEQSVRDKVDTAIMDAKK